MSFETCQHTYLYYMSTYKYYLTHIFTRRSWMGYIGCLYSSMCVVMYITIKGTGVDKILCREWYHYYVHYMIIQSGVRDKTWPPSNHSLISLVRVLCVNSHWHQNCYIFWEPRGNTHWVFPQDLSCWPLARFALFSLLILTVSPHFLFETLENVHSPSGVIPKTMF